MKIPIFFCVVVGLVLANDVFNQDDNLPPCPEGTHRVRRADPKTQEEDNLKTKVLAACVPIGNY